MKRCYCCKQYKSEIDFNKCKTYKDGLNNICKICNCKKVSLWNIKNKEKRKEYLKMRKDRDKELKKAWDKKNKIHCNKYQIRYKKRRMIEPNYKIAYYLRNRLRKSLIRKQKQGSAIGDLGCSVDKLIQHLEQSFYINEEGKKMTWENYGAWHIDHIIPLCSFDLTDRKQLLTACNYINLQPLWAKDNLSKGGLIYEY